MNLKRRVDPAWFSAVMGTAGTAAVLGAEPLGQGSLQPVSRTAAWVLLVLAWVGFSVLAARMVGAGGNDWADMGSPEAGPAYATIPGAMLVLLTATAALAADGAVAGGWWWAALLWNTAGAALSVVVTVRLFVSAFVHDAFPVEHMSGAWFVPETALLLSGMLLGRLAVTVPAVWTESLVVAAFALVGAGAVLFALTAAVFFTRLILYPHVQESGAPAMWIMLSPLSITALATHQVGADAALLNSRLGSGVVAVTDLFALLLWGFSLWWIVAAAAITWRTRAAAITHLPADWSYVFPPAALALATLSLGRVWGSAALEVLGAGFSIVLFALWSAVAGDTVRRRFPRHGSPVRG